MSRPSREFHEYLTDGSSAHVSHQDYLTAPGTAFLKYTVEAKSAIDLCIRKFPKKNNTDTDEDGYIH